MGSPTPLPPPRTRTTRLEASPDAPAEARWFLWSNAADPTLPPEMETAALLVSELVSNAVRHADSDQPIDLSFRVDGESMRVSVRDTGPTFNPETALVADDRYGLRLVDALADRWGGRPVPDGMEVWFEL
ncbi:MAG TPA: ATP-binding protein [Actinomycetota bacterium]|nr:ATP-binding protein [Actinomycetota bacterium]